MFPTHIKFKGGEDGADDTQKDPPPETNAEVVDPSCDSAPELNAGAPCKNPPQG